MASGISEAVKRFLAVNIVNVAQLEMLLFLRRERSQTFSADDLASPLRTRPVVAERDLAHLAERRLIEPSADGPGRYRYAPGELDAVIDQVADVYAKRRTSVVNLIFAEPHDSATSLADAFRFRRP
jgi:hypothetical protein